MSALTNFALEDGRRFVKEFQNDYVPDIIAETRMEPIISVKIHLCGEDAKNPTQHVEPLRRLIEGYFNRESQP